MTLPSDLAAIRARCEAATPGPWRASENGRGVPSVVGKIIVALYGLHDGNGIFSKAAANITFIAHARTDLPLLLARLEEMRTGLEKIQMYAGNAEASTGCRLILDEAKSLLRPLDAPG